MVALGAPAIKSPPRDRRKGRTMYDGYERCRDEDWTVGQAIVCTMAILLGRRWNDAAAARWSRRHGKGDCRASRPYLAHFDAQDTCGGYEIWWGQLAPGCRFEVFSDGECLM